MSGEKTIYIIIHSRNTEKKQVRKTPQIRSKRGRKREMKKRTNKCCGNYSIPLGIRITVFCQGSELGILLGIRITVFCQGSELQDSFRDPNYCILLNYLVKVKHQGLQSAVYHHSKVNDLQRYCVSKNRLIQKYIKGQKIKRLTN